jgi:Domain of unknown function (DUF4124)
MRHSTVLAAVTGLITCALLCGIVQAGDVYKYVDEHGNTMYTDRPMPGAVKVASGVVRPPEATARSYAAQQTASNQQLSASNQKISQSQDDSRVAASVAKDLEASRLERCKKAREDYENSINHRRLYRQDKDGNKVFLSDAELSQERIDARKNVDAICGPQG